VAKFLTALLAVATATIALVACGDDDDDPPASPSGPVDASSPPASAELPEISTPEEALLTVHLPPGETAPAWPNTIASGDFNADEDADLLLGAPLADGPDGARVDAGAAYVLFGPFDEEMDAIDDAGLTILGAIAGDNLGSGVASGDLNADGADDIIVGASGSNAIENIRTDMGEAYVIFGRPELEGTIDTLNREQDFTLQPAEGFAQVGRALAAGDVNGDGTDDLVAGAPYGGREPGTEPGGPRTTVGEVYVVYGAPELGGLVSVADAAEDLRLAGLRESDQFGQSLALADVAGDPTLDIIVGASGWDGVDQDRDASGAIFVFVGGADLGGVIPADQAELTISGAEAYSLGSLLAAVDLDGDASVEIASTAPTAHGFDGRASAGRTYLITAPDSGPLVDLEQCDCATAVSGPAPGTFFASTLASRGDLLAMGTGVAGDAVGKTYVIDSLAEDLDLSMNPAGVRVYANSGGDAIAFADIDSDGVAEFLTLAAGPGDPVLYATDSE
jgi:FG-GAP repeat